MLEQQVEQTMMQLVANNIIVLDGDSQKISLRFAGSQLLLNGQPADHLLGMLPM